MGSQNMALEIHREPEHYNPIHNSGFWGFLLTPHFEFL